MQNRSNELMLGTVVSFSANCIGVFWALGWLALGGLGVGMSSSPTEDLQQIWNSFVCMAMCLPVITNLALVGAVLVRRKKRFALGWLLGLLLSVGVAGCLIGMIAGYLMFLNCYPGGPGTTPHC
jgi:hypothetical protein